MGGGGLLWVATGLVWLALTCHWTCAAKQAFAVPHLQGLILVRAPQPPPQIARGGRCCPRFTGCPRDWGPGEIPRPPQAAGPLNADPSWPLLLPTPGRRLFRCLQPSSYRFLPMMTQPGGNGSRIQAGRKGKGQGRAPSRAATGPRGPRVRAPPPLSLSATSLTTHAIFLIGAGCTNR